MKPDLKVKLIGGVPHISYTRKALQGIKLYGRINDGSYDFETTVQASIFDDTRARINPNVTEVREYYAYFMHDGLKVGRKSDVIRVVLDPIV